MMAREEAREIIKRVCNANENDALIFCGTGATAAVNLFVNKIKIAQIAKQVKEGAKEETKESTGLGYLNESGDFSLSERLD